MPSYMVRKFAQTDDQTACSNEDSNSEPVRDDSNQKSLYSRRSALTLGASIAAILQSPTVTAQRTSTVERSGIQFREVQNAVEDLGMDPTGQKPIDSAIVRSGDDSLIQFPEGSYRFDADASGVELANEVRGFEAVGEAVSFVAPEGYRGFSLSCTEMDGIYIDGIDIDQTAPDASTGMRLCGDRVIVRDVELLGGSDVRRGGCPVFSHATLTPDGASRFENVVATAGKSVRPVLGRPGIFIEEDHTGAVSIRDCDFREFPDAAVYAGQHSGTVAVRDSYFENNTASIRIAGAGSSIERCEIVVDDAPARPCSGGANQQFRQYGIAVAQADPAPLPSENGLPVRITDTSIQVENVPIAGPAVAVPSSGSPLELRNCDIEYNNDDAAVILCRKPGESSHPARPLRMDGTTITGNGSVDAAVVRGDGGAIERRDSPIRLPESSVEIHQ